MPYAPYHALRALEARICAMLVRRIVSPPSSDPPRSVIMPGVSLEITPSYRRPSLVAQRHRRHTYATEMLRAGVGFPALMKLLGHTSPEMTMRYLDVALTDLQREFNGPVLNPGILFPSQRCRPHAFELASMESSILCSLLNMCWRCSAAPCHTAVLVLASIASQTGSPRFSAKRASSAPPENGQRLAGYADNAGVIAWS